ncbi:hypothetical protein AMJ44_15300 [candidate division WOR-1 bacterium DG_54_3]|uniref:Helix-turn-helix domain-containing protein n=1 Tax=candidate division WOR-1 bacterium DG_54_3 TaxID=1703775 RepID=A0A0S7XKK0_UNCSA|nr:MAG: hypothetical protein AMJ44_15300 [candidate division WOR-1 bacterium DG_54_3]
MNDNLFTVKELAEYLKVNPATVYRMVHKGGIPAFKVGKEWRFKGESIDSWILGKEHESGNGNSKLGQQLKFSI